MDSKLQEFGLELYKQISKLGNENVILSPFSVSSALALTLLGSRGKTAEELKASLQCQALSNDEFHLYNKKVLSKLEENLEGVTIENANRLFPEISFPVIQDFVKNCSDYYGAQLEPLNFKKEAEKSRLYINEWVSEKTKGKITDLLPNGSINSNSKLVLANAIYFKGDWLEKFKESETVETDFFVNETETKKVKMMVQQKKYKTFADDSLDIQAIEVPYKNPDFRMVLLVPNQRFGLIGLEQSLTSAKLQSIFSGLAERDTILGLPKMKVEHEVNLVPILHKMGVNDLFEDGKANLRGIADSDELVISGAFHKACINVNEEGSEAAAATGLVAMVMSLPLPPQRIICDHPFMFLIRHASTSTVFFLGRVASPSV